MKFTKIMVFLVFMVAAFGTSMSSQIQIDWILGPNYQEWAKNNHIFVGDTIIFHYNPQQNNVYWVNKEDYESCSTTSPIALYASGWDTITLTKSGSYYYFSGYPGSCEKGQKVKIHVEKRDKSGGGETNTPPSPPGQTDPNTPPQAIPMPNDPNNPNQVYPIDRSSSTPTSANWLAAISATCVAIVLASFF